MENSISALAYSGSITDAIAEAKMQKKLFVVYISGTNVESTQLEESIWMDSKVAESISKYCILLHISAGSTDAENFSAIYPQKPAPCITAIGYNGAQLWQNGGFVGAELLASTLEKAWLSLHIQETTATFLSAALASNKLEPVTNSSNTAAFEEGSSSSMDVPSPSADKHPQSFEARGVDSTEMNNDESVSALVPEVSEEELSTRSIERVKEELNHVEVKPNDAGFGRMSYVTRPVVDHHPEVTVEASQLIANEAAEAVQDKKAKAVQENEVELEVKTGISQVTAAKPTEAVHDKKKDAIKDDEIKVQESFSSQSTEVHLNIRLLDGASLQEKFLVANTLRMVKDYVDQNQASAMGSYDLAIPYPRKVFNEQDLNKTLSELGLVGRHALIVVPHHRATGFPRAGLSSPYQTSSTTVLDSSNEGNGGYFAFVKRILSYANPLSYLRGSSSSSNSARETPSNMREYGPNSALQDNLRGTTPMTKNRQATSSRFGSNIHTLKHDEDDTRFSDRNAFWNGNSTQYGGDNDGK